jgi:D-3-phosphoglycerate dehydrogenase
MAKSLTKRLVRSDIDSAEAGQVKVLFLGEQGSGPEWYEGVRQACGSEHAVSVLDPQKPIAEQFVGINCVVDQGGSVGTHEMMDAARKSGVKFWQILGTGLDHVDVPYLLKCGFLVANCPGKYSAIALAEHSLFLMLYLTKQFPATQDEIPRRRRAGLVLGELYGKTLGLVGFGASGQELARRAMAMGMTSIAIDARRPSSELLSELNTEFLGGPDQLQALVRQADVISLHVPLLPSTERMINREVLSWMQPHAILINVARGGLVDTDALVDALREKRIGGAGLDVFASEPIDPGHPLLKFKNVVATPHIAGTTQGTASRRGQTAAESISRVAKGLPPLHQITESNC